nr:hypothetical protein [Tanacetum cinerariifolium]
MVGDMEETSLTTLEAVNQRMADLAITLAQDTYEIYAMDCNKVVHAELLAYRAQFQTHETHIQTRDARIRSLETRVMRLMAQTSSLQTQLTTALGRIHTLEVKELAHTDNPKDVDSSA